MDQKDLIIAKLRDALYTALNLEGVAKAGANLPAWNGIDVDYHYTEIRKALKESSQA